MDVKAPIKAIDSWQQRHKVTAVAFAVVKKFGEDQAGNLAALVAYFAFFSLFPLLLVFVTILSFVLSGDHAAFDSVRNSVLGQFPVIGDSLRSNRLHGNAGGLIIGIVLSLWAGLAVTKAAGNALDVVWGVPRKDRPGFLASKLRGVILLVVLGAMFIVASGASGVVTGGLGGPALRIAGYLVSLALNYALFMVSFQILSSQRRPWREHTPGALLAAIFWTILQTLGGLYINHTKNSSPASGTFALVLGVLAWLYLGAQLTLYAVELNTVLAKQAWPRSLLSGPAETVEAAEETREPAHRDAA